MSLLALLALGSLPGPAVVPPLIPKPMSAAFDGRELVLRGKPVVVNRSGRDGIGKLFAARCDRLLRHPSGKGPPVRFILDPKLAPLGPEGYRLTIGARSVEARSSGPAGLFYAEQTLLQMTPEPRARTQGWAGLERPATIRLPRGIIEDQPRFAWRGLHLDCSRHFWTVDEIKRYLDTMAMLKLNVFHWHLIDEGGWRMEVRKYPRLTSVGAWRTRSPEVWGGKLEFPGPESGNDLYGGYYTQAEIRDVVEYARRRNIETVPEIEMPGHILPAIWAYPWLGCDAQGQPPGAGFPTYAYCVGKESTYQFLRDVLDEAIRLFPSKVVHIGGDEVNQNQWLRCPDCQPFMRRWGIRDTKGLQSYFMRRIEGYLNARGRLLMGWDEILDGGLAPKAMVMSWRGVAGGIEAAHAGHPVVMSPTSHCYFDYSYATTPTEKVYGFDPVPWELRDQSAKHVLGGQANVWTEWMPDFKRVETMLFPRILAMSEALWTPSKLKSWPEFESRLNQWYPRLQAMGVAFHIAPPSAPVHLLSLERGRAVVRFTAPAVPGSELQCSRDGGPFVRYRGPITVDRPAVIVSRMRVDGKPLPDTATVSVIAPGTAAAPTGAPGLRQRFLIGNFTTMPDCDPAAGSATDAASFDLKPYADIRSFALFWTGWFRIEKSGPHRFTLGSDDGSMLWVGGALALDNNRLQAYTERSAEVWLAAGWYPVRIGYFEGGGGDGFRMFHQPPNGKRRELQPADFRLP